jgi:hypothetical protein
LVTGRPAFKSWVPGATTTGATTPAAAPRGGGRHGPSGGCWAVSGYGLRAWRALAALTVLLVGSAALFTLPVFAHLPAAPQHVSSVDLATGALGYTPGAQPGVKPDASAAVPFGTSLEFTATESLTLIRASGDPLLKTTTKGTALDMALRLLAPLLLGLALLAVRGRTKR